MNFDDEYRKLFSEKKLSEDFVSSLSEKMAKEALLYRNKTELSETEQNTETSVIKKSHGNIFSIFKKASFAAACACLLAGISLLAALNIDNISSSKKGNIKFHDDSGRSAAVTTSSEHTKPLQTNESSETDNYVPTPFELESFINSIQPEVSCVPDEETSLNENLNENSKSQTAANPVSEVSSTVKTSKASKSTTISDGINRWPVESDRQKNSLVEFSLSDVKVSKINADRTVEVDMNIGKNSGFTAFVFCIQYDKSAMDLTKVISKLPAAKNDKMAKTPALGLTKITNKSYDTICYFDPESAVFYPVKDNNFICCKLIFKLKDNIQPGKYTVNRLAPDKSETELINVIGEDHKVLKPDFSFKSGSITIDKKAIKAVDTKKKSEK